MSTRAKRQHGIVVARQQNQINQALVDVVHMAVLGVFQVFAYDSHQDVVRGFGGVFEIVVGLLAEEARHVGGVHHGAVIDRGGVLHVAAGGFHALRIAVKRRYVLQIFVGIGFLSRSCVSPMRWSVRW